MSGNYLISTPLEIKTAKLREDLPPPTQTTIVFDGLSAWGYSFDIVDIQCVFRMKHKLEITSKSRDRFKGITFLHTQAPIYDIRLGYTEGQLALSLLLLPQRFVKSREPESKGPSFDKILRHVYEAMANAIRKLNSSSETRQSFISSQKESRILYREDVGLFSKYFNIELARFFTKKGFIFCVQKMGQDLLVSASPKEFIDELSSKFFKPASTHLKNVAANYSELNLGKTEEICFHIAYDLYPPRDEIFMWNLKAITFSVLGQPHREYNPFFLPGKGNVSYGWESQFNSGEIKHLQMYLRVGHQAHRLKHKLFTEFQVAKRFARLYSYSTGGLKSKLLETRADTALLQGEIYKIVEVLAKEVTECPPIRCEVVFGTKTYRTLDENGETCFLDLEGHMEMALRGTSNWVELYQTLEDRKYFCIKAAVMKEWILHALGPCKQVLIRYAKSLNQALEPIRNSKEDKEKKQEGDRKGKKSAPCKTNPPFPLITPSQFLNIAFCECFIGFFFRGCLPNGTPRYIGRHLGFFDLGASTKVGKGAIKNVEFSPDDVRVHMHAGRLGKILTRWMSGSGGDCETLCPLQIWQRYFGSNEKVSADEKLQDLMDMTGSFCTYLQSVALNGKNIHDEEEDEELHEADNMNLQLLRSISWGSKNNRKLTRTVISIDEFISMMAEPTRRNLKLRQKTLITQYLILNDLVEASLQLNPVDQEKGFRFFLTTELTNLMLSQNCALYFRNGKTILAVVPFPRENSLKMGSECPYIEIYADAFMWMKNEEAGRLGISCRELIVKSLVKYFDVADVVSIPKYFELVLYFLDTEEISGVHRVLSKKELTVGNNWWQVFQS